MSDPHVQVVGNTPPMPTSEAEWACHWAFYQLTIKQRDAAWRQIEKLRLLVGLENRQSTTLCRKCGGTIDFATQCRFGSRETGWEHMEGECK